MEYREFRAEVAEVDGKLSGILAPFNRETTIGDLDRGGWREEIAPGAFTKALRESDTVLLCDHDMSKPLARVSAGTLRLRETASSLDFDADVVDTSYARDTIANVRAKNKGGMSIGFYPVKDDWYDDGGAPATRMTGTRRVLREVKLPEGSVVTNPAYKDTAVFARDDSVALLEERAAGTSEDRAPKPYGDVAYADEKNGKYPIDKKHVKAAWAYINQAKNAAKYPLNGVTLASVKAKIKAAMKKFGFTSGSAGEQKFEFVDAEWRDDDPYFDDWYEIDADAEDDEREDATEGEGRDDPDGHEYEAIDTALRQLKAGDVKGAEKTLAANQAQRGQEPDSSTPEDEDDEALRFRMRSRELELELEAL
jgi:HK97 family phage prohead protease